MSAPDQRTLQVARFICQTFVCPVASACGVACEPGIYTIEKAAAILRIADQAERDAGTETCKHCGALYSEHTCP